MLKDVRDYIAALKITEDEHCYCGKMTNKQDNSIGVYNLKQARAPTGTIGGDKNSSYGIKGIALLVHWNKKPADTEEAAVRLYEELRKTRNITVNGHNIKFIKMLQDEPVSVDTDEYGIFEYVIECLFYYGKEEKS